MMPITPPLRFASTYRFAERLAFQRLARYDFEGERYKGNNYDVMIVSGFTAGLLSCNGIGIRSKQGVGIAHLLPKPPHGEDLSQNSRLDPAQLPPFAAETGKVIDMLGGETRVRAFLTGGMHSWKGSYDYGRFLYRLMHQAEIPTTTFWGQPEGTVLQMHHDVALDTWTLNCGEVGHDQPASLEALKQRFKVIEIAPGDRLELGGEVYTNLSINTDMLA